MLNHTCWLYAVHITYTEICLMIILTVHEEILTSEEGINPSDWTFLTTVLVDLQEEKDNCNHWFDGGPS
jgi:hypothetical protein